MPKKPSRKNLIKKLREEKEKANKKVMELLSKYFKVRKEQIIILSGKHYPLKTIKILE